MKIKKLTTALTLMPFGAAAALTASGSGPYYGNVSTYGTAAIDARMNIATWKSLPIMPDAYVVPIPAPVRGPRRRKLLRRIQQSIKPSLSSNYNRMSYAPSGSIDSSPDRSSSPSASTTSASWFGTPAKNRESHRKQASLGSMVQPGKVVSKEERKRRNDSVATIEIPKSFEEQRAEDLSFKAFYQRIAPWEMLRNLDASLRENLAPEAAADALRSSVSGSWPQIARHLIVLLITFLIVFGALYSLVTHLLNATRASAQCSPSTVLSTVTVSVPVIYTHTESVFVSPSACTTTSTDYTTITVDSVTTPTVVHTEFSTSTLFSTQTITVVPATPVSPQDVTSSTLPFVFNTLSGTTSWVNGVSPSSGASLTTEQTTILVTPGEQSAPLKTFTTTSQTTQTHTTTITPAAETTISTSLVGPDLTSTNHITRTDTVSSFVTLTRTSFGGVGTSGWNATASQDPIGTIVTTTFPVVSTPTTATISFFWASSGGHTYSTSTKVITTTLYRTMIPVANSTTHTFPTTTIYLPSSITSGSTSGISANGSSPATNDGNTSEFPTMSPGTGGISPTSGTATGASGSTASPLTSPQQLSSEAQGATGDGSSVFTSALSSNSFTNSDMLSSIGSGSTSAEPSATVSETAYANSSTSSLQGSSTLAMGNSTSVPSYGGEVPHAGSSLSLPGSVAQTTPASAASTTSPVGVADITDASTSVANASMTSVTFSTEGLSSAESSLANVTPSGTTLSSSSVSSILSPISETTPNNSNFNSTTSTVSEVSTSSLSSAPTSESATLSIDSSSRSTTSSASKTTVSSSILPTACGEHGDFVLDFDDLPSFSGDGDITQAPPIFAPYHHLTFSNGYVHAPKTKQPFAPHSGDQLAVFVAPSNGTNDTLWQQNGMSAVVPRSEPGDITDGPFDGQSAYWFDARGAWLGCDNDGPEPCNFNVTGSTWDPTLKYDVETYNAQIEVPACPNLSDCKLQHVDFPDNFRNLSGIQIEAFAKDKPVMFFMDDPALGWSDNSCEAGMQRMSRPGSSGGPGHSGGTRKRVVRRTLMR